MLKVIPKVAVIAFLNNLPFAATGFVPFHARVWFATGPYLRGVWSRFIIKDDGTEWRSTWSAIWCWNINLACFFASSGISGFDVVHVCFLNPMRLKRSFAQDLDSKSIHFKYSSWLLVMSVPYLLFFSAHAERFEPLHPKFPTWVVYLVSVMRSLKNSQLFSSSVALRI